MNKSIKKIKALEKEVEDGEKPDNPSMSFRFNDDTLDKLSILSELLNKKKAAIVRTLIHEQYNEQVRVDEAAVSKAKNRWKNKSKTK